MSQVRSLAPQKPQTLIKITSLRHDCNVEMFPTREYMRTRPSSMGLPSSLAPPRRSILYDPERGDEFPQVCEKAYLKLPLHSTSTDYCTEDQKAQSIAPLSAPPAYTELWGDQKDAFELSTGYISRISRWLRWNFFSAYRRLFAIVLVANLAFLCALGAQTSTTKHGLSYHNTLTAASTNLALSTLVRNEHVVNLLFLMSSSLGPSVPLVLRRWLAKIYGYGGIHSGCAVSAVIWYLAFAGLVADHVVAPPFVDMSISITTSTNVFVLLMITVFAHPSIRARYHDLFECTHRFAAWVAVLLFWAQTIVLAHKVVEQTDASMSKAIVAMPTFWCLLIMTICILHPWVHLRQHSCTAEPLSSHATRLHFTYGEIPYCSAVRFATNPLKATHAFAAIPNVAGEKKGFSVVISNAGDWTNRIVKNPPSKLWIKGTPFLGVLRVAVIFKPVLIVATGSGIGPCLSLFHGAPWLDCRVLWSTPSPVETYGKNILDDVLGADPGAVIVDTRRFGRPDLVRLTWGIFKRKRCEAVVVISNAKATKKLVYGLETRGIPAYGPIFDS